ncbi:putative transposase YbfD/YdcC [Catalinimonas alkaloidigena]|uniref:hypothetical protein n=1 Tax=Catalinimonas alkaloidigena TaxID=1075417 RepID=UPI00240604FC|nr:hypothetical protein [Catalinimonas alkaloidigena]MDF9798751.1 putative transposase YbfD/YdcC [Catalinimonas alkaloidigena]
MKRSVIALAALATFSFASFGAQANLSQQEKSSVEVTLDDRKEIKYEELPEAVKVSFEDSQFSNWEVSKVHEVKQAEKIRYEITLSDGTQTGTIAYDKNGNMIG